PISDPEGRAAAARLPGKGLRSPQRGGQAGRPHGSRALLALPASLALRGGLPRGAIPFVADLGVHLAGALPARARLGDAGRPDVELLVSGGRGLRRLPPLPAGPRRPARDRAGLPALPQ